MYPCENRTINKEALPESSLILVPLRHESFSIGLFLVLVFVFQNQQISNLIKALNASIDLLVAGLGAVGTL